MVKVSIYTENFEDERGSSEDSIRNILDGCCEIAGYTILYGDGVCRGVRESTIKIETILPPLYSIAAILQACEHIRQTNKQKEVLVTVERDVEVHYVRGPA